MLTAKKLGYEVGGHPVFRDVSLTVNRGDKIGLVGKNGVGKTTLLNVLSGDLQPTEGTVDRGDYEIGVLPQDLRDWLDKSVYGFVEEVTGVKEVREDFEVSCKKLEDSSSDETMLIYANALEKYTRYDVGNFDNTLEKALALAGIRDIDVDKEVGDFSGGQKTRIALAALFAAKYDVILLDEPTNNLDTQGVVVLEKFIGDSNSAFMMISHDRRFLRNATSRIIELMGGDHGITQYGLGYDEYVAAREAAREAEFKRYEQYELDKKKLKKAATDANNRASAASNSRSKSDNDKLTANFRREKAARGMARTAQALSTRLEQMEAPEEPQEEVSLNFNFKDTEGKAATLIDISDLTVKYDSNEKVFGPLSLHIKLGDRVAITGENGIGKSSLLKAMLGEIPTHSGERKVSDESRIVYMDQQQTVPLPEKNAVENLQALAPGTELHDVINLLLRFGIKKEVIHSVPAEKLSGGERAKITLASIAAKKANILIMDEPTNNLDIPTIEALERALQDYNGSIIMVSHDRDFLANLKIEKEIKL